MGKTKKYQMRGYVRLMPSPRSVSIFVMASCSRAKNEFAQPVNVFACMRSHGASLSMMMMKISFSPPLLRFFLLSLLLVSLAERPEPA